MHGPDTMLPRRVDSQALTDGTCGGMFYLTHLGSSGVRWRSGLGRADFGPLL